MDGMLAIDVGNTHITSALIDRGDIREIFRVPTVQCLETGTFFGHLPVSRKDIPREIVVSSVRKAVSDIITKECARELQVEPFIIGMEADMGITNRYRTSHTLGIDRLVNACAGYHLYGKGCTPLVIIDMGTATTIDYVTGQGEFLGGAIAPGLLSAYRGLLGLAPELPRVEISPVQTIVGETTDECMRSGVIASHAAMVRSMAAMMAGEKGTNPGVIVTGGLSSIVANLLPGDYIVDEHLTIRGLSLIYDINNPQD